MAANASDVVSPLSAASAATFPRSKSTIRGYRANQSTVRTVVTSPPWARDEPPSPRDEHSPGTSRDPQATDDRPPAHRPSDVTSYTSSVYDDSMAGPSRWWAFTRHRPEDSAGQSLTANAARHGMSRHRDRSYSVSWLAASLSRRPQDGEPNSHVKDEEPERIGTDFRSEAMSEDRLHLDLPPPPQSPITLAQTRTPGWETPWTPRAPGVTWDVGVGDSEENGGEKLSKWQGRKKRIRVYMLTNTYVPLLFRLVNIAFTTSALAIAIHIRRSESRAHISGALGSSPTLVIIFAPLTLVHVMIAIYLDYFGRPLGLWRTSAKLAHTLVEVVFICAWSAALALSFDNFFTSSIPCASLSSISWYNQLPRPPPPPIPGINGSTGIGGGLCDNQIALISLVGVGLIMYCFNLVISLYRIFEKVKYHPIHHSHG
ncbi:uncharacterized protein PHACADRAFT_204361 [Phanerochaete carnosa HHB-10118-sp]|uniref:Uncharacterized protein n=1 Tax=Phanerochaete carnosa (strain HHB-10118-sp) TaxID=650164 RepID=K5XDT4_PHACS|nr:uncharacterized protein PHACADRAFT_204361 [Phanerochaete carnosa HHB-10118-sp]EKM61197.1 hypothetical protein PHACADRAFT_204361 [Phanerochaete carnosa HHB-10118-sp]